MLCILYSDVHVDTARRKWRNDKTEKRKAADAEAQAERKRRGLLTGREIFMQNSNAIQDDEMAGDDAELQWEIDQEAEIALMEAQACKFARIAREAVRCWVFCRGAHAAGCHCCDSSTTSRYSPWKLTAAVMQAGLPPEEQVATTSQAAGIPAAAAGSTLQLTKQEEEELFEESDDDDDLDLDELENEVREKL